MSFVKTRCTEHAKVQTSKAKNRTRRNGSTQKQEMALLEKEIKETKTMQKNKYAIVQTIRKKKTNNITGHIIDLFSQKKDKLYMVRFYEIIRSQLRWLPHHADPVHRSGDECHEGEGPQSERWQIACGRAPMP